LNELIQTLKKVELTDSYKRTEITLFSIENQNITTKIQIKSKNIQIVSNLKKHFSKHNLALKV